MKIRPFIFKIAFLIAMIPVSTGMTNELDCKDCDRFAIINEEAGSFFSKSSVIKDCTAYAIETDEDLCNCNGKNDKFSISKREQDRAKREFKDKLAKHAMDSFQNNVLALSTDIAKYEMSKTPLSESAAKACTLDRITEELEKSCKGSANYKTIIQHAFGHNGLSGLKVRMQGEFANILSYTIPSSQERAQGVRQRLSKNRKICVSDLESYKMEAMANENGYHSFAVLINKHKSQLQTAFASDPNISIKDVMKKLGRRDGRTILRSMNNLETVNGTLDDPANFKQFLSIMSGLDLSKKSEATSTLKHFFDGKGSEGLETKCNKIYGSFKDILCSDKDLQVTTNGIVLNELRDRNPAGDVEKLAENNLYETAYCSNIAQNIGTKKIDSSLDLLQSVLPEGYGHDSSDVAIQTYENVTKNNLYCPRLALWNDDKSFTENKKAVQFANNCPFAMDQNAKSFKEENADFCVWLDNYMLVKESIVVEQDALLASQKSALKNEDGKRGDVPAETKDVAGRSDFAKAFLGTVEDKEVEKVVKRAGLDKTAPVQMQKEMLTRGIKIDEPTKDESTSPKKENDNKESRLSNVAPTNPGTNYAASRRPSGDDSSMTHSSYFKTVTPQNSADAKVQKEFAERFKAMIKSAEGGDEENLAALTSFAKSNSNLLAMNEDLIGKFEKVLEDNGKPSAGIIPVTNSTANKETPKKPVSNRTYVPDERLAKGHLATGTRSYQDNDNSANGNDVASNKNEGPAGSKYSPHKDWKKIGAYTEEIAEAAEKKNAADSGKSVASRMPASSGNNVEITDLADDKEFENEIYVKVSLSELENDETNEIKDELAKKKPFIFVKDIDGSKVKFKVIPSDGAYQVSLVDDEIKGDFGQYVKQIQDDLKALREHQAKTLNSKLLELTKNKK